MSVQVFIIDSEPKAVPMYEVHNAIIHTVKDIETRIKEEGYLELDLGKEFHDYFMEVAVEEGVACQAYTRYANGIKGILDKRNKYQVELDLNEQVMSIEQC